MTFFECGHPASKSNSQRYGRLNTYVRCRQCANEEAKDRQQKHRDKAKTDAMRELKSESASHPAVLLYRAEKARRGA